jgi:hypothetical protein
MAMEKKVFEELVEMFQNEYKYYKGWSFAFEHPGVFTYHQMGGPLSIAFTPEFDKAGVVPIQVMHEDGSEIESGSIRYMHPENVEQDIGAWRLFKLVRPYLEKYGKW